MALARLATVASFPQLALRTSLAPALKLRLRCEVGPRHGPTDTRHGPTDKRAAFQPQCRHACPTRSGVVPTPSFLPLPRSPQDAGPLVPVHLLAGEAVEAAFANGWAALFTGAFICS